MLDNHDFFGQIENDKIREIVYYRYQMMRIKCHRETLQFQNAVPRIMADEYQLKSIISVNFKQHDVYSFFVTGTDNILNTRSSM